MVKQICNHVALTDLEIKAQEFISLSFAYCEEQQRLRKQPHPYQSKRENAALAAACLSVQRTCGETRRYAGVYRRTVADLRAADPLFLRSCLRIPRQGASAWPKRRVPKRYQRFPVPAGCGVLVHGQAGSCENGLRPLLKRLAGLPGDHIDAAALVILTMDSQGRPMPSVLQSGAIPTGMSLVLTDHEGSFDRYFAFVLLGSLQRVEPVFVFTPNQTEE